MDTENTQESQSLAFREGYHMLLDKNGVTPWRMFSPKIAIVEVDDRFSEQCCGQFAALRSVIAASDTVVVHAHDSRVGWADRSLGSAETAAEIFDRAMLSRERLLSVKTLRKRVAAWIQPVLRAGKPLFVLDGPEPYAVVGDWRSVRW